MSRKKRSFLAQFAIIIAIVFSQDMFAAGLGASYQRQLMLVKHKSDLEFTSLKLKKKLAEIKNELSQNNINASQKKQLNSMLSQYEKELVAVEKEIADINKVFESVGSSLAANIWREFKTGNEDGIFVATSRSSSNYGRFHALVIGNQNYRHLNKLETPISDAKAVAEVLEKQYGFTVELLLDKTRDEIMLALAGLRKTMTSEEASLLIYYAGHGYLDKTTETGYWQPVDAERDNERYWISTGDITVTLKAIQARHVLVVADSCYSGSLLRDSGAKLSSGMSRDEWLKRMFQRRSRTALTSGGEEPVADGGRDGHSVFAWAFLEVLRSNRDILDGDSLFDRVKRPIVLNADQTPHYEEIKKAGHDIESGDFLFVPKELQIGNVINQQNKKTNLSFLQRSGDAESSGENIENLNIEKDFEFGGR